MSAGQEKAACYLSGPVAARDLGKGRATNKCSSCGRTRSHQDGTLKIELLEAGRSVWLTDANAIVIRVDLLQTLGLSQESREVEVRWAYDAPAETPPEMLVQVAPKTPLGLALPSDGFCEACGAVRRISFSPLLLAGPMLKRWSLAFLSENPDVVLFHPDVAERLLHFQADLVFEPAYLADEYRPATTGFEDWSDL